MKERMYYHEIDFMRSICALAVIGIHITSIQFHTNSFAYYLNLLLSFAVPTFLFLSGLSLQLADPLSKGLLFYYKRRYTKALIPYIIWSFIYWTEKSQWDFQQFKSLSFYSQYLFNLLTGNNGPILYFMVIILQLYLIYPFLAKVYKRYPQMTLLIVVFSSFLFTFEGFLSSKGIVILPSFLRHYIVLLFPRWWIYFLLGMWFAPHFKEISSLVNGLRIGIFSLWTLVFLTLLVSSRIMIFQSKETFPMVMLYALASILLLLSFSPLIHKLPKSLFQLNNWFAKQAFAVYFLHLLVIRELLSKIPVWIDYPLWQHTSGLMLYYVVTIIVTGILVFFISLLPFSSYFGCVAHKKVSQ